MTAPTTEAAAYAMASSTGKRAFRARLDALRFNRKTADKAAAGVRFVLRKTRLDVVTNRVIGAARWAVARMSPVTTRVQRFASAIGKTGIFSAAIYAATTASGRSFAGDVLNVVTRPIKWVATTFLGAISWSLRKFGKTGQALDNAMSSGVQKTLSLGYRARNGMNEGIVGRNLAVDSETMRVVGGIAGAVAAWRVGSVLLTAAGIPVNPISNAIEIAALVVRCIYVVVKRSWAGRVVFNKVRRQVQPMPMIEETAEGEIIVPVVEGTIVENAAPATVTVEKALTMEKAADTFLEQITEAAKASHRTVAQLLKESDDYIARLIEGTGNGKHAAGKGKPTNSQGHKPRERSPEAANRR